MKTLLLTTALAAVSGMSASAQDAAMNPFQSEASGPAVSVSDIIGARIYASEAALDTDAYSGVQDGWDDIGEVNDVIIGRDGTVDAVLVDIGGFLGMGERQVAVDMAALKFVQDDATDADDWFLVLQADRSVLEGAPDWVMPGQDAAVLPMTGDDSTAMNEGTAADAVTDPAAGSTTAESMSTDGDMALPEGYASVEPTALTAETLTGADVRDASDAEIAEVSDLVLTEDGQVTHLVVDVGGFLGMGAKSVALPMENVTVAQRDGAVRVWVNMTREELEAMPEHSR